MRNRRAPSDPATIPQCYNRAAMAHFEGFADARATFFKSLAKNNERQWFLDHKEQYEEGWQTPMKLLLADVRDAIDGAYPHLDLDEPKVFRIFRDVRFSKDKTPYKTHVGGFVPLVRKGKKATDFPWPCTSTSARPRSSARRATT